LPAPKSYKRTANPLLARLDDKENILNRVYTLLNDAAKADRTIAPAGEWLLDNFYLIEERNDHCEEFRFQGPPREFPEENALVEIVTVIVQK